MARSPDALRDGSPLSSPRVDVRLRIGWLLRTCRLHARASVGRTGKDVAHEIGVNPALVTRWEKGTEDVDRSAITAYERLTGLDAGALRAVIDLIRRLGRHPTAGRLRAPAPADLDELSALTWPAMHGEPRGVDWLNFADVLNAEGGPTLPDFTAAPVIDRLAGELGRSCGVGYIARYEALARLRSGPYGVVTLRALLAVALAPDSQVALDLLDVAAAEPSGPLFADLARLLADPRPLVFYGAARGLLRMLTGSRLTGADLEDGLHRLALAHDVAADPHRQQAVAALVAALPDDARGAVLARCTRPVVTATDPRRTPDRGSVEYKAVRRAAAGIRAELGGPEDDILVRVLFEALFDQHSEKRRIAACILAVLPYRTLIYDAVGRLTEHEAEPVRDGAVALACWIGVPHGLRIAEGWAVGDDPGRRIAGLATLGLWADRIDPTILQKGVEAGRDVADRAIFAAGMTRSPLLREWAEDPGRPERVQAAAHWWLRHGGRVTR